MNCGDKTLKADIKDQVNKTVSSRYHRLSLRMDDRVVEKKGDCEPRGPFH